MGNLESEMGTITKYAVDINQDYPRETKTYGHSIYKRLNM